MRYVKAIILDASALIQGYQPVGKHDHYTVPEVLKEVKDWCAHLKAEGYIESGRIKVESPRSSFVESLENITGRMGESRALSEADKSLLALGLDLEERGFEAIIISDDYSVQNVASKLGLKYTGLATPGIRRRFTWRIYCPGCGRIYENPQEGGKCPVCGTELRRKPIEKESLRDRDGI